MKRKLLVLAILSALPVVTVAAELQKSIKSRWLGAWVVVTSESYSDCRGGYTNNHINGNLVKSAGHWRFGTGELAKLDKVDLKRSRLDLHLTLAEGLLVPYQDGPFTLYNQAWCRVELQIEIPRNIVKRKDAPAVERFVRNVVERYSTETAARDSESYNGRQIEPYPDDYDMTLARHAVWKAERTNARVQSKIDHALEETGRLADRMNDDTDYLAGLGEGVEAARSVNLDSCKRLLAVDLGEIRRQAAKTKSKQTGVAAEVVSGYQDGKALVYGLEMIRRLPACFVPVPTIDLATEMAEVR